MSNCSCLDFIRLPAHKAEDLKSEETYEYLDRAIRNPVERLAWRLYGVPRRRWIDPSFVGVRCDFTRTALRYGLTRRLTTGAQPQCAKFGGLEDYVETRNRFETTINRPVEAGR